MLGRRSGSRVLQVVGLAAFVVGLVGYFVFGWRFGGTSDPVATALGVIAVVIAIAWTLVGNR